MDFIHFDLMLTTKGWKKDCYVSLDNQGTIIEISNSPQNGTHYVRKGIIIPGFINTHSHAFQYAMVGTAELVSDKPDTFWTWRSKMYELAIKLFPDQLEYIAEMAYAEMLRNGYVHVVEFHYMHNEFGGGRYEDRAELGLRLLRAAENVGIGITLVPVCYQKGGFGKGIEPHQTRFQSKTVDEYFKLIDATKVHVDTFKESKLGAGVHSLRAVGLSELKEIFSQRKKMPFHLHISEQEAEVKDCLQFYKSSPVNLLMDEVAVDENVHLVHGTHITKEEMTRIVNSGASVILCPSTEGNLGDGTFSFREFLDMGGTWSIGSDSHVGLNPLEDLRWLDYGQRLLHLKRDTFRKGSRGMGEELYKQSIYGGNKAAGLVGKPGFEKGMKLTGLVLNENHPLVFSTGKDLLLNALIYNCDSTVYEEILVNGSPVIVKNSHENYEEIANNFKKTMKNLGIRL